jgi:hypothetical protein
MGLVEPSELQRPVLSTALTDGTQVVLLNMMKREEL